MATNDACDCPTRTCLACGRTGHDWCGAPHPIPPTTTLDLHAVGVLLQAAERNVAAVLMTQLDRLIAATNIGTEHFRFILPDSVLVGVEHIYGVPVVRAAVAEPMV